MIKILVSQDDFVFITLSCVIVKKKLHASFVNMDCYDA